METWSLAPLTAYGAKPGRFEIDVRSLDEVRDNIDRLDRAIIALMAERGRFVQQAARFKVSRSDVEAPKRWRQIRCISFGVHVYAAALRRDHHH